MGLKLEFRAEDGAWYEGVATFADSALRVHFDGYHESEDEVWSSSRFDSREEMKLHIREASKCMQDDQCRLIHPDMLVCGACKFPDGGVLFHDAIVKNVKRRKHLVDKQGEEICSCSFEVVWHEGLISNAVSNIQCGDICLISSGDIRQNEHVRAFWKLIEGREMSIDKGSISETTPIKRKSSCLRKDETTSGRPKKRLFVTTAFHNANMGVLKKEVFNNNQVNAVLQDSKRKCVFKEPSQVNKHNKLIKKDIPGKIEVEIQREKCDQTFNEKPLEAIKGNARIAMQLVGKKCKIDPDAAEKHYNNDVEPGRRSISSCILEDENGGVSSDMLRVGDNSERFKSEHHYSQLISSVETSNDVISRVHDLVETAPLLQGHFGLPRHGCDTCTSFVKREQLNLSHSSTFTCIISHNPETHNCQCRLKKLESSVYEQDALASTCKSSPLMFDNDVQGSSYGGEAKGDADDNKSNGSEPHFNGTMIASTPHQVMRSMPDAQQVQLREKDGEDAGSSTDCFGLVSCDPRGLDFPHYRRMKTFGEHYPTKVGQVDKLQCSWQISQMLLVENMDQSIMLEAAFNMLQQVSPGLEFLCILPTLKNDSSAKALACYQDVESADLTLKNLSEKKLSIGSKGRGLLATRSALIYCESNKALLPKEPILIDQLLLGTLLWCQRYKLVLRILDVPFQKTFGRLLLEQVCM